MMNHDELRDSIPALALHALPEGEQELVESHVSRCTGCSFEYSQYQEVAALLAHLVPAVAPPPSLWHRIEQSLTEEGPRTADDDLRTVIDLSPVPEPGRHSRVGAETRPGRRSLFSTQRVVGLVAAAVVVVGGAGIVLFRGPGQQDQQDRPGGSAEITYSAIASGPHTVLALRPTTRAQRASGEILVAPDGKVAVAIHGLAAPGSGTYTMWLAADGQTRSLGDFRPDASGEVRMATAGTVGHSPKLVVTLESQRGNTAPTGPPILSA